MLLRIFKGTGPGIILLIAVTLLSVWASAFIRLQDRFSLYFDLDPMPLYGLLSSLIGTNPFPGIVFTLLLVSLMAYLMVSLNTNLFFINERTFLPALFYILLSGLFPQFQLLNPVVFAAMFLMLAIRRIMEAYRIQGTAYNFFDAGILIGIGSLFYVQLIWFGLLIIIGIILIRTVNVKEIVLSLVGLATPYLMTFGIYYAIGKDLGAFISLIGYNLFGRLNSYAFTGLTIVILILVALCIILSILFLFSLLDSKKIKSRKTFFLLIWCFLISAVIYIINPAVSVEIVWIAAIPVSYFLSHYFIFSRKRLVPELIFSLFLVLIIVIQVWYVK